MVAVPCLLSSDKKIKTLHGTTHDLMPTTLMQCLQYIHTYFRHSIWIGFGEKNWILPILHNDSNKNIV